MLGKLCAQVGAQVKMKPRTCLLAVLLVLLLCLTGVFLVTSREGATLPLETARIGERACTARVHMLHGDCVTPAVNLSRPCIVGSYSDEWQRFASIISAQPSSNDWKPFALVRYGDGEFMLIRGDPIGQDTQAFQMDKFWHKGGHTQLGGDLLDSLQGHFGQAFYYGFGSPRFGSSYLPDLLVMAHANCWQITFSNIWVNANYPRTKVMLENMVLENSSHVVLLVNHLTAKTLLSKHPGAKFAGLMQLPDQAPESWQGQQRIALLEQAVKLAGMHHRKLFVVSAGPMAKVLVSRMWSAHPDNQYIDFGSAFDEIGKGVVTRPYMTPGTVFADYTDPCWSLALNTGLPVEVKCP